MAPDKPLMLLAQINFEEMPSLEDFHDKGILQIYIEPEDDRFFGCDDRIRHFEQKNCGGNSTKWMRRADSQPDENRKAE